MEGLKSIDFFGLNLTIFDEKELLLFIDNRVASKKTAVCFGYSLGTFPYFKKHPVIASYSNTFDISVCDGRGMYLLSKVLGFPVKSDISIPNMTWKVLELANRNGYSVMIVGSTKDNNLRATKRAQELYPMARIFPGNDGGFFSPSDQEELSKYINSYKPDILLIGVSSPKKESFAYHYRDKLDVSIIIPFGGAIDILSGKSKPIPPIIKKMLLGFLWRWFQEPRRLFRDSILYPLNIIFLLLPTLFFNKFILRRPFSIPAFYNKSFKEPIAN